MVIEIGDFHRRGYLLTDEAKNNIDDDGQHNADDNASDDGKVK
jgi:hypothetical protein